MAESCRDGAPPMDLEERLDRQPSALSLGLLLTITALLAGLFVWMGWARVDRVITAEGRVIPAGRVKWVNHPEGGRVVEIRVAEGQRVTRGQLLLRLEAAPAQAAYRELVGRIQQVSAEVTRLEAEAGGRRPDFGAARERIRSDLARSQTALSAARTDALQARRKELQHAIRSRRNAVREQEAEVARLEDSLELLRQQFAAVRDLAERGLYPRLKMMALARQVSDNRGELRKARAALAAAREALDETRQQLAGLEKEWRRDVLTELERARAERERLQEELEAQKSRLAGLEIRAPVDGIVEDLEVTAVGQAIPANRPIMKLVPVDAPLVVEARVANEDIGELHEGMPAVLKVRAFDFLRYGTLSGHVRSIALDADAGKPDAKPSYRVTVSAERPQEHGFEIRPGMLVDVEFKAGQRTILSYLTERLWRKGAEMFRER